MRTKPLYLSVFPILSFLIALSFPMQIYYLYGIEPHNIIKVLNMLTPLNLLSMALLMVAALLSVTLNRNIYRVLPALILVVFLNNAIVGVYGTDYTLIQVAASFILFAFSIKPFYESDIREVIFQPKLRWWDTPKRFDVKKPLKIQTSSFELNTVSENVSKSGLFARFTHLSDLTKLEVSQIIELSILGLNEYKLKARVVRISSGEFNQPVGVGLEIIKDQNYKGEYLPWVNELAA